MKRMSLVLFLGFSLSGFGFAGQQEEKTPALTAGTANGALYLSGESHSSNYFILDFQGSKSSLIQVSETEGMKLSGTTTSGKSEFDYCYGGEAVDQDSAGAWDDLMSITIKNVTYYSKNRISSSFRLIDKEEPGMEYWTFLITKEILFQSSDSRNSLFLQPDSVIVFCLKTAK
jgi:hypothetical protein